jgi:hypothetical protein
MKSRFARGLVLALLAVGMSGIAASSAGAEATKKPVPKPGLSPAVVTAAPSAAPQVKQYAYGRIIVLRGLANVFSRGMDKITEEMKARGLPVAVYNHQAWNGLAADMIAEYKTNKSFLPIIIIGHSLGADAAVVMANWLGRNGVPVRLVVCFDGVAKKDPVINTIAEVLNYYKPRGFGQEVTGSANFTGTITNIDLTKREDIDHLNIDKDPVLHDEVITKVLEIMKKKPVTAKGAVAAKG